MPIYRGKYIGADNNILLNPEAKNYIRIANQILFKKFYFFLTLARINLPFAAKLSSDDESLN